MFIIILVVFEVGYVKEVIVLIEDELDWGCLEERIIVMEVLIVVSVLVGGLNVVIFCYLKLIEIIKELVNVLV